MLGTIHLEPLEVQAKYADQICRELVDTNDERLKSSLEESRDLFVEDEWNFCYWNTTAVGNAAYAALNGKNENVAQIARDLLERYKAWRQKRQWEQRMSYGIKFVTTLVLIAVLLFAVR